MAAVSETFLPECAMSGIDKAFPKVFELTNGTLEESMAWVKENIGKLEEELVHHGALLFRGFPIQEIQLFHDFLMSFGWNHYEKYIGGGGPRNIVMGPIYNSTDSPPEFKIPFHHEMAYLSKFPEKLIFYCDIEPAEHGETPILLSHDIITAIQRANPDFLEMIRNKGVRYIRTLCDKNIGGESLKYQKSWQDIFGTTEIDIATALARDCGSETVEWGEDGSMKLTTIKFDGIALEKRTQKETWFNAICLLHRAAHKGKNTPWEVVYGDYSAIADSDVIGVMEQLSTMGVYPKWKQGDMLLVDNRIALHSRNIFTPPRRILAAFAE